MIAALVLPSPASAAVKPAKPGGACLKVGATTWIKGSKYVCTKSGTKKIWTAVKKPDYYSQFGVRGPVFKAIDAILAQMKASVKYTGTKSVLIAEDIDDLWARQFAIRVNLASDRWRWLDPTFQNPTVIVGETSEWLESTLSNFCPWLYHSALTEYAATGCTNVIAVYAPRAQTWDHNTRDFVPGHESFHSAQFSRSGYRNWQWIPSWFQEGSAQLMGALSAADDANGEHYHEFISESPTSQQECGLALQLWIAKQRDQNQYLKPEATSQCEYGLGRRMVSYLLSLSPNVPGLLNVYTDVGNGMSFNRAMQKHFGMTTADFYAKLQPYLAAIPW